MNLPPLPEPAEADDLFWHALNYRTAATQHAEGMWLELESCVARKVAAAVAAERATQADALHVAYSQGVADGRDAERERCATLCETASYRERWMRAGTNGTAIEPCRFAAAIRELGQ